MPKIGFQDQLLLNVGLKYCRMLHGEHSAILLTFIKLPFVIKIFVLSIFEWSFSQVLLYCILKPWIICSLFYHLNTFKMDLNISTPLGKGV